MQVNPEDHARRVADYVLLNGYRQTQCLSVAVRFGLFDRLLSGTRTAAQLAEECSADTHSMIRLLRALVAMQVLSEDSDGRFEPTSMGILFTTDELAPLVRYMTSEPSWRAWSRLGDSVRTGQRAFDIEFGIRDWDYYADHQEIGVMFDAAMRSLTTPATAAIMASHDFSAYQTLADIGGGDGSLLIPILLANIGLAGILFDRPQVVERAHSRLVESGLDTRCRTVGGSFLEEVPGGADAYLMKWILHDWEDRDAQRILNICRRAMRRGTDLIVIERVMPERVGPESLEAALADLQMMVMNGGVERTESQFRNLLSGSGFHLVAVTPTATQVSILRAVAV